MILFLHGAGERGTNIWKVATHGPAKHVTAHSEFPFIVVSPQCPEQQIWSKDVLLALLEEVTEKYAVDTSRIYLTGSEHGRLRHVGPRPDAPGEVCGHRADLRRRPDDCRDPGAAVTRGRRLGRLGVWAFHGGKDPVVPLEESQRMVDALKKAGVQDVKLTVYPEAQHDSWTETYKNPELYEWLLKHERQK